MNPFPLFEGERRETQDVTVSPPISQLNAPLPPPPLPKLPNNVHRALLSHIFFLFLICIVWFMPPKQDFFCSFFFREIRLKFFDTLSWQEEPKPKRVCIFCAYSSTTHYLTRVERGHKKKRREKKTFGASFPFFFPPTLLAHNTKGVKPFLGYSLSFFVFFGAVY